MKLLKFALVTLVTLFLTGCITAGQNFKRLETSQIEYGKTTTVDVIQDLGDPYRSGSVNKRGKKFETITYAFSKSGGEAGIEGVTPARSQLFYFYNDILVGTEFTSSWKEDFSDFDDTNINKIKENSTTLTELVELLGPSKGEYIYPLVENKDEKAKVYLLNYVKVSGLQAQIYTKQLVVSYKVKTNIVSNVEYTSQAIE